MHIMVKICGLTTTAAVDSVVEAGADAVGFVFAESPRQLTVAEANELAKGVPPGIARVAVMRHPTAAQWSEVEAVFQPDWLQTDVDDFATIELNAATRRIPVYRDTAGLDTRALAREVLAKEELILFEAGQSGVGRRADWGRAAELAKTNRIILAGGLDPANVSDAIARVRPWGVDVSSGVEQYRGCKDPVRIAAFVQAVRDTERLYAN